MRLIPCIIESNDLNMNAEARNALRTIRRCVKDGRYRLTRHFTQRMDERGLVWADVLAVLDQPTRLEADGYDDAARSRWIVQGPCADGSPIEMVCAIGRNNAGDLTVFITLYWER